MISPLLNPLLCANSPNPLYSPFMERRLGYIRALTGPAVRYFSHDAWVKYKCFILTARVAGMECFLQLPSQVTNHAPHLTPPPLLLPIRAGPLTSDFCAWCPMLSVSRSTAYQAPLPPPPPQPLYGSIGSYSTTAGRNPTCLPIMQDKNLKKLIFGRPRDALFGRLFFTVCAS